MTARNTIFALLVLTAFGCNNNSSTPRVAPPEASAQITSPERVHHYQGVDAESFRRRGILYLRQGLPQKAKTELATATSINPADAEAHYMLGICHIKLGEMAGALVEEKTLLLLAQTLSDAGHPDPNILPLADDLHEMIERAKTIDRTDYERSQEVLKNTER